MKYGVLTLPLALMLAAGTVSAAEPINKQFDLIGAIPTESFVIDDVGKWWGKNHELVWIEGEGFALFAKKLAARSTIGPITAHLTLPPQITSANDDVIDMEIKIGGKTLSTVPQEVVSSEQVAPGRPVFLDFHMGALHPAMPKPGEYTGNFGMVFESAPPL